jgi:lipopolysaccharide export system protein LptA
MADEGSTRPGTNTDDGATGAAARARPSRVDLRRAGLIAAVLTGVAIVALVSLVVVTRRSAVGGATTPVAGPGVTPSGPGGSGASGQGLSGGMDTLTGPTPSGPGAGVGVGVGGDAGTGMAAARTGAASVKFFDKADSTRVSAQLSWQKLEPMAGGASGAAGVGEAVVQEPRGYVYLRDGSIAAIRAVQGAFFTPKGGREPESGRFEGGVTVEVFDPQFDAQGRERPIDLTKDRPSIIAQTRTLVFNAPEAELSTQDSFTIDSERMSIAGTGALIIFDQVEEGISRGEFVRVDQVRIWPGASTRPDVPTSGVRSRLASRRPGAGGAGGESRVGGGQERTRLYRLTIEDDVAIRQGPRRLLASRVEGWMTLVNNKLADGAIGQLGPLVPRASGGATGGGAASATAAEAEGEPITATWNGRMVLVPTASVPVELRPNLVALRLMGGSNGPVRVIDEPARLAGEASIVDYGATNRTLVMRVPGAGAGGAAGSKVVLSAGGAGTLVCTQVRADLPQGKVEVIGAGELDAARADGAPALFASWSEGLTLTFATKDGWLEPLPTSATARGNVQARGGNGRAVASGQVAEITFGAPVVMAGGQSMPRSSVREITLSGDARASSPRASGGDAGGAGTAGGVRKAGAVDEVRGQTITLSLEPVNGGASDEPRRVSVRGAAKASSGPFVIEASEFNADLTTDSQGRTTASKVVATGSPRVTDAAGLSASSDRIEADPNTGMALLTGNPVSIVRDGVTINAATVRLDQRNQTATIDGSGRAVAVRADDGGGGRSTRLETSWSGGAVFDARGGAGGSGTGDGRIDARGTINAEIRVGEDETNVAQGETMVILLAPVAGAAGGAGQRQIRSVEIFGRDYVPSAPGVEGRGAAAKLTHRTMGPGRAPLRTVYLEGGSIIADADRGTLVVPGAGKLLVDDRSGRGGGVGAGGSGAGALASVGGGPGRSLFAWSGDLELNRSSGRMFMRRQVQLWHRPPTGPSGESQAVLLDCDELQAMLRGAPAGAGGGGVALGGEMRAELVRVEAIGNVQAETDGRKIIAQRLVFDAASEVMSAEGSDEQLVTFVDPTQSAPVRARAIEWNLREKRISTEGVAPIILTPR